MVGRFSMYNNHREGGFRGKKFGGGGFGGGFKKSGFGDRGGFGGRGGFDKPMHSATCASCGNGCQVPFKPNGSKPVLCNNCFRKDGDSAPRRFDRSESFGGRSESFGDRFEKRMYQSECASCGNSCEVPFKPNGSKPVYCNNCFRKDGDADMNVRPSRSQGSSEGSRDQFKAINDKLDAIMVLLQNKKSVKAKKEKVEEAVSEEKEETVAADPEVAFE